MYIAGLDLGTSTGWALYSAETGIVSGTEEFKVGRGESPGMRYVRFRGWLKELTRDALNKPSEKVVIAYEQPHHRGGASTEILVGFSTCVQELCAVQGFNHTSVHTATLKKFATGHGRANKLEMAKAAEKYFTHYSVPQDFDSNKGDDEADALWVLAYVADELNYDIKGEGCVE